MEGNRFDQLMRDWVASRTRRSLLQRLSAFPLAAGLATVLGTGEEGEAKKRNKHGHRHNNNTNKHKNNHHDKKCTKAGGTPKPRKPCCKGLTKDQTGLCSGPHPSPPPGPPPGPQPPPPPGCSGANPCPAGQLCESGNCVACDVCGSGCTFDSIQAAIDDASQPTTIRVCPGTYNEDVTIGRDLTLRGAGDGNSASDTIVEGSGTDSVVNVTSGTVVIQQLRITGGHSPADGGGVHNVAGADLTLDHCTVADNRADGGYGGGIYNETGATLRLTNCTVTGNDNDNGYGPGIANLGDMTVEDSAINENGLDTLPDPWGGGIYGEGGSTTITNSTLNGNKAQTGGGIMVYQGSVELTDCDISNNVMFGSSPSGGGIFADADSTWTVTNCTITHNTGAVDGGGGIWTRAQMTLTNCTVSDNESAEEGGGIFNDGVFGVAVLTLDNTDVTGNTAGTTPNGGGGVYNDGAAATISCTNGSTIGGNTPDQCFQLNGATGCNTCPAA